MSRHLDRMAGRVEAQAGDAPLPGGITAATARLVLSALRERSWDTRVARQVALLRYHAERGPDPGFYLRRAERLARLEAAIARRIERWEARARGE